MRISDWSSDVCSSDFHAAAHLFADGDLAGGMRNLWDIHCLIEQFGTDGLAERARHHGLEREVHRAARLAHALYATAIPEAWRTRDRADALFRRRLPARDEIGRASCRESMWQYVYISVVALSLKKTKSKDHQQ